MKIAFMMDPPESLQPASDTTSHLMVECNRRGHTVFFFEPHDVSVRGKRVVARMRDVTVDPELELTRYWQSIIRCARRQDRRSESLDEIDALLLRCRPPLDHHVLVFLQGIDRQVFILNSTAGQILGSSRLYILNFPEIIPETHVSRDPSRLRRIIDDFGGAMVVKPLQRIGGDGVIKVSNRDRENLDSLIDYYVRAREPYARRRPIMVQEYLEGVQKAGAVRILLLDGKIIGAMRRKPGNGCFIWDTQAGGEIHAHELTLPEKRICRIIRDRLIADGLYLVSIDIIDGKLVKINCVCPGGIARINRLHQERLETKVIDFIEQKIDPVQHYDRRRRVRV